MEKVNWLPGTGTKPVIMTVNSKEAWIILNEKHKSLLTHGLKSWTDKKNKVSKET